MALETFLGKCLVRRARDSEGKPVVILCGVFRPEFDVESIDDRDEMWAVRFQELSSKRFVNTNVLHCSPEDFLRNYNDVQDPANWELKPEK